MPLLLGGEVSKTREEKERAPDHGQVSGDDPYQPPVSEAVVEIRCRAVNARLSGTRPLDTTDASIHSSTGEVRFGIVPDGAFPLAILVAAIFTTVSPFAGFVGYLGSYFLSVAFFPRTTVLQLKEEVMIVDSNLDVLAIKKRRKGRSVTIAFAITPHCYQVLPKLNGEIKKEALHETSNFNWHLLAFLVIVIVAAVRFL